MLNKRLIEKTIDNDKDPLRYNIQNGHPIIEKHVTPYYYSNPSQAFDGVINPLERRITTQILSLDTEFRENYELTNSNKATFILKNPLYNVISMRLISLELPRMWYSISDLIGNNTMKIELYNMSNYPNSIQTITIPNGNYSNENLISTINNIFMNKKNGLEYLNFDINSITSKSYFYVNNEIYSNNSSNYSPNFYYVLDFTPVLEVQCQHNNYSTLGTYLGFNKLKYSVTQSNTYIDIISQPTVITYEGYIASLSSAGINLDNYIFVYIDDFNKNHNSNGIVSQTTESLNSDSIIGRVALPTFSDSLIINNNSDAVFKKRDYYGQVRIRQLEISLLNKHGKPLDLFNNNYSLALEFETLYNP
jgi:hypothetical protein